MNPPLRSAADRDAMIEAILDGVVDAIATDHAPHAMHEKEVEFERAPNGITGLETALGLCLRYLHGELKMPLGRVLSLLSAQPAAVLGLKGRGTLAVGSSPTQSSSIPKPSGPTAPPKANPNPKTPPSTAGPCKAKSAGPSPKAASPTPPTQHPPDNEMGAGDYGEGAGAFRPLNTAANDAGFSPGHSSHQNAHYPGYPIVKRNQQTALYDEFSAMIPHHRFPGLLLSLFLLCLAHAQTQPAHTAFEIGSVKPAPPEADPSTGSWSPPGNGRFQATHVPLSLLIQLAYGIDNSQISNKPGWLDTNLYDVDARAEDGVSLSREELKPRLQQLLHDRFHLVAHKETHPTRGYALVVAKGGPHLTPTKGDHFPGYRADVSPGQMRGFNWSMPQLAKYLTAAAGFPVVEQTGISGSYDIAFSYDTRPDSDSNDLPPLARALKEATGLLLEPQKIPVETLVIDSVDKTPTAN